MKKLYKLLLCVILISLLMSCRNGNSDDSENIYSESDFPSISPYPYTTKVAYPMEDDEEIIDWKLDSSGEFSYLEYTPSSDSKPYFIAYSDLKPETVDYQFPDNRFLYEQDIEGIKMYGYMDENFRKLSYPISIEPYIFQNGLARIQESDCSYIINENMEIIPEYYPGFVAKDNSITVVNWTYLPETEPYILTDVDYDSYLVPVKIYTSTLTTEGEGEYKIGFAPIGKVVTGVVNDGDCVVKPIFDEARLFYNGLAAVKKYGLWGFMNQDGDIVIECKYDKVNNFYEGVTGVYSEEKSYQWALLDTLGNSITWFEFEEIKDFHEGYAKASKINDGGFYLIRTDGSFLNEKAFVGGSNNTYSFSEGYMLLQSTGYNYLDETGNAAFMGFFDDARAFSDGVAAVKKNGYSKWDFIDETGVSMFGEIFEYAQSFSKGFALVKDKEDEPGYLIDKSKNKFLQDLRLYSITRFNEDGYALAYGNPEDSNMKIKFNDDMTMSLGDNAIYYIIKLN